MATAAGEGRGPGDDALRSVRASNPSPLTLDGTRTYLVGRRRVAVIDPGPDLPGHQNAVAEAVGDGVAVAVLVTHDHPDHSAGAAALAQRLGVPVRAARYGTLADGDRIATDAGELVALATPGHTPDHVAFHWPEADAVFCGDLMLGGRDTTLVAPPEGDLGDYLASLERIRRLAPAVVYPAHGPPFAEPDAAIDLYIRHRRQRERQVLEALGAGPAPLETLVDAVYGHGLEPRLRAAATGATRAYLEHLERSGRVRRRGDAWERV